MFLKVYKIIINFVKTAEFTGLSNPLMNMKVTDIAHLCGYFSTTVSDFEKEIASDGFWTSCQQDASTVESCKSYYFPEFVDLCMVEVKTYRHECNQTIQVQMRDGSLKPAVLTDLQVSLCPFGIVLYSIGLRQDEVLMADSFHVLLSARMLISLKGDSDFEKYAVAPLDALRIKAGAEKLLESGNKYKIFHTVVADSKFVGQQEFDKLLFSAGTMSMYDENDEMSFCKSYFDSIISEGRLSVFRNWSALSLLDTYTILAFQPKEFMLNSWENDYFTKLYQYSLFRKFFLFRLNDRFRSNPLSIKGLMDELESFIGKYSFPMVSYNFLPELVAKSMEIGLDIEEEKEKITMMVTREKERKELEVNDRMNLFLGAISFLTLFSAIWDFGCLVAGMNFFGDGTEVQVLRACTMLIVGVLCLIALKIKRGKK